MTNHIHEIIEITMELLTILLYNSRLFDHGLCNHLGNDVFQNFR